MNYLTRQLHRFGYGTLEGGHNTKQAESESFSLDGDDVKLLEENGIDMSKEKEHTRRANRRKAELKRLEWGLRK